MTEPTGSDSTSDQSPISTPPTDLPTSSVEVVPTLVAPVEVAPEVVEPLVVEPVVAVAPAEAAPVEVEPTEVEPETWPTTWDEIGLPPHLRSAVEALGWTKPTPVQARCFTTMVAGKDVLVQSQTGSGKTGAFCLPWLASRFQPGPAKQTGVQLLVLLPTRELAKQVCDELVRLATDSPVDVLPVYGGTAMAPQLDALARGVHAVVGTPGRILDHIRRRSLDLSKVRTVVLDECDEMLSMGFLEDIRAILSACPTERQTCLYSATVPRDIERIARRNMRSPERIELSGDAIAAAEIDHAYYSTGSTIKTRDLLDMVMLEDPPAAIVFCNTREETRLVATVLQKAGYVAEALSSDLTQTAREKVMGQFRERKLRFLVATDVAARGIDVSHVSHVINYSFPENSEVYVHRTGRTGRAGRAGVALSLISPMEIGSFYTLTKSYKSIKFTERAFPPPEQLAPQRIENKLDRISHDFAEPVSPEWVLLARNLANDPRGERVIAYLLHAAIEDKKIPTRRELAGEEPDAEAAERTEEMREYRERERRPDRGARGPRDSRDRGDRDRGPRGSRGPRDGFRDSREGGQDSREGARDVSPGPEASREGVGEPTREGAREPGREGRRRDRGDRPDRGEPRSRPEPETQAQDSGERRRRRPREDADARPLAVEPGPLAVAAEVEELPYVRVLIETVTIEPLEPIMPIESGELAVESEGEAEFDDTEARESDASETADGEAADGDPTKRRRRRRRRRRKPEGEELSTSTDETRDLATVGEPEVSETILGEPILGEGDDEGDESGEGEGEEGEGAEGDQPRKRRRSRRRRRGKKPEGGEVEAAAPAPQAEVRTSEAPGSDEGRGASKRRRKRKRTPSVTTSRAEPPPPEPMVETRVSQDEIVLDIDERELDMVRDEFGEIDEFDELTIKGRRRAVLEELTDDMEVEDLSAQDSLPSASESGEFAGEGDDFEDDDGEEADAGERGPSGEAGSSEELDSRGKKKRRRRRRKKTAVEVPELSCPPHKDFWEVWAARFSAADFVRESDGDDSREAEESPSSTHIVAHEYESDDRDEGETLPADSLIDEVPDEATLARVKLNLGRRHGYKASGVRALLKRVIGLHGKAIKDLTVRDQDTLFRMDAQHLDLAAARLDGQIVDTIALTLVRADEDGPAASAEPVASSESVSSGPSASEPVASAEPVVVVVDEPLVVVEPVVVLDEPVVVVDEPVVVVHEPPSD